MPTARHSSFVPWSLLVLTAGLFRSGAIAQAPARPTPYQRALVAATADAQQRIENGLSLWSDHSTWEQAWVGRTERFAVRTTSSYGAARDLAQGLEVMIGNLERTLGRTPAPTGVQNVYVFPDLAAYNQFGNQFGEHHSSFYGSFFAPRNDQRPVAALWSDNATLLRMQVTHSAVHQYLAAAYPGRTLPAWLDEGLAAHFAAWWDYGWTLGEYERLRAAGELPPLPTLLQDGVAAYVGGTHARMTELAMLFYWLLRFREDTRTPDEAAAPAPFRDYVTALLEGRPTDGMHCALLFADAAQLDEDLRAFTFPR